MIPKAVKIAITGHAIQCIEEHQKRGRAICQFTNGGTPKSGGMCYAQYIGAVESLFDFCSSRFFDGNPEQWNTTEAPGTYCSQRLYSDCMVTVLADDKQAPVVNHLEDITIYCDGAPDYAGYPNCEHSERFDKWPLQLKDSKGVVHGYYGGSDF
ncbi:MAG: hypothetical protein IPO69_10645 [Saprospiraceae bacterium]|nr:hypothetical protein [Saprospiraceae bacterium]